MSRRRVYGEDFAYPEAHREALPALYGRIGHRLDVCDRDWTEFCHWCKEPLGIYELVRDIGQDLNDKATTITRKLASRHTLPAFITAWRIERDAKLQARIDALNRELIALQTRDPIAGFRARQIWPRRSSWIDMTPAEWWQEGVLMMHRHHHANCVAAQRREIPVDLEALLTVRNESRLWTPSDQLQLFGVGA